MTNDEIEIVLKDVAALIARTAIATADLVEKGIPNVGPFGDRDYSDVKRLVQELRQDALKLRESLDMTILNHPNLATNQPTKMVERRKNQTQYQLWPQRVLFRVPHS